MKLREAAARLQESLDAFDADVSDHLENETERADLWHDMDANAEDIRTVLAALTAAAKVRTILAAKAEEREAGAGDLVARLRDGLVLVGESESDDGTIELFDTDEAATLMAEGADLIELFAAQLAAVTAENARLREALKPFAQKMDWPLSERDAGRKVFCQLTGKGSGASFGLDADDFIRARTALSLDTKDGV